MNSFRPPRSLFFTIFLWFFAAQLAIGGALYLLAAATERRFDRGTSEMAAGYIAARAQGAAIAYELGGKSAAQRAWRLPLARGEARGPGASPGGSPDGGPEDRASAALFVVPPGAAPVLLVGVPPELSAAQLRAARDGLINGENGTLWLARSVNTPQARYLGLVRMNERGGPPDRGGFWGDLLHPGRGPGAPIWSQLARWSIIALVMGALCYALARYLTAPAVQLSRAARQFAEGDYSTRVGPQLGARRDELADLGRDFDFMAERIESQRAAERRLLGDISHELRSPLARLQVALDLAESGASPQTRGYLRRIESEVEELGALIGQLLTLTRLENVEHIVQDETLDLASLVAEVCADADFEASATNRTVELIETQAATVRGNQSLLRSALENVVRNALTHAPDSSQVAVALTTNATEAIVRVRDWGPGVPEDALDQLFRPFYRVATARDRQSGGTGLGLSITERALRAHGGSVRATNAQGGGLEVEMRLPLAA